MKKIFDEFSINIGEKVKYCSRVYEITSALSLDEIILKDIENNTICTAKISKVHSVDAPSNIIEQRNNKIKSDDLAPLDITLNWHEAKRREETIKELALHGCSREAADNAAAILNISDRQVYILINKYRQSGFKLTSLLPKVSNGGKPCLGGD